MKKTFFITLCILFPFCAYGQLDVYLSSDGLEYGRNIWTSANYPDSGSNQIQIDRHFSREEFPPEYQRTSSEVKDLVDELFPALTGEEKQDYFDSLIIFDSQRLSEYIAISISPDTQTNIADKESIPFLLSSFESTFQNCSIDLIDRQDIARSLITDIHNGQFADVNSIRYSDIRYGDCIIPFPDERRGTTSIADSFSSNKLIAASLSGNHLRFGALEDSVNLFSLSDIILDGSYVGVQDNNLLNLQSTRVEQDRRFEKQVGKDKILFVHQNHYKNIFKDVLITGNSTSGYTVSGTGYTLGHPLHIQSSDSEEMRVLSGWQEVEEGIYSKTLVQEDTFELVSGIYIPKQNVGVTTYYAIVYNYDTTPPECPATLFSHESAGNENFIFPENPWFGKQKYGYFVCNDEESGCFCDTSTVGCFVRDDEVLSIPQKVPHAGNFQYRFWNGVGLSLVCSSSEDMELFYDTISPDMSITIPGIPQATLIKEYVNNQGVLYNGEDIKGERFYNITNDLLFQADDSFNISLELYDAYDSSLGDQGVSGLRSYSLSILKFENDNWVQKINKEETFGHYNPGGDINVSDIQNINFNEIDNIESIFTRVGEYQVYVEFDDAAGNKSRVIFHFDIVPGDIDISNSTLEVMQRNTVFANNTDYYRYTLTLKDEYLNSVSGKSISSIDQSCTGIFPCLELRLNMDGASPSGGQALNIFDLDSISDDDGIVRFSLSSKVPGQFTESFIIGTSDPASTLRFSAQENSFLYPVIGTLESLVSGNWVSDTLPVGELTDYRILIEDIESSGYNWSLTNFSDSLEGRHDDTDFVSSGPLVSGPDGVYFSGTFTSTLSEGETHKTVLEIIEGNVSGVGILYDIGGQAVRYKLSSDSQSGAILALGNTGELENPVKVIGNLQGVGNTHNIDERQNMTDIDTHIFRNILRKNVGKNLHLREHNTIVGGVKYIDKTLDTDKEYRLGPNPDFETLIVRNGNIHIDENFNTQSDATGNIVGIISYIDGGYNEETGYNEVGNIYVEHDVTSVNALIYADGGLVSTNGGNPISGDISIRNDVLQKQLTIKGSLFTRNTLAGGRELTGNYMLPGGEITNEQSLATQYDLYYARRGNAGCETDDDGFCNIQEYLIIHYDPRVVSSPPRFFDMK